MLKTTQFFSLFTFILAFAANSSWATLKVMPLGDSLTAGGYNENGQWEVGGGYRAELDSILKQQGLDFIFVGSLHDGPADFVNNAHEGHSGFRIDQINASVEGWLQNANPDVILLMIGTNDFIQGFDLKNVGARYEALLTAIENALPQAKIIVANTIPTENETWNSELKTLSSSIVEIVIRHKMQGRHLEFVDMYNESGILHNRTDLIDGVHPNPIAYQKLAPVWAKAISCNCSLYSPETVLQILESKTRALF